MRKLPVDIDGLDLMLGGGFALLERVAGAGESATILIRGSAGSGKTVLGTQFAASIARALGSDVAYGCVELLPSELKAQYEDVRPERNKDKVVLLAEEEDIHPEPGQVRLFAGLLDLGEDGSATRFGHAVEALLEAANARANQRQVRVVVIDSLSDGYGLGASAPRSLADGVSKFAAERGLVIILLEEQAREGSSIWSFAVDTVFEIQSADETKPFERRLLIPKNRLGPSDPGPHEFMIRPRAGVMLMPRVKAYQRQWRREVLLKRTLDVRIEHPWTLDPTLKWDELPSFRATTTAVVGDSPSTVRRVALWLGSQMYGSALPQSPVGKDIRFVMGQTSSPIDTRTPEEKKERLSLTWGPLQSGPQVLFTLMREIGWWKKRGQVPKRVLIGDLSASRYHSDPDEIAGAISVLASFLRDLRIPLVLYESGEPGRSDFMSAVIADVVCTCMPSSPENQSGWIPVNEREPGQEQLRLDTDQNSQFFSVWLE